MTVAPSRSFPLGATVVDGGVNFCVYSAGIGCSLGAIGKVESVSGLVPDSRYWTRSTQTVAECTRPTPSTTCTSFRFR